MAKPMPVYQMTQWEAGLLALASHYECLGGLSLYGSYIRDLRAEAARGCKNRRVFRTVVAEIFDCDKWSPDIVQMANAVQRGDFEAMLNRAAASQDFDLGAVCGGAQ